MINKQDLMDEIVEFLDTEVKKWYINREEARLFLSLLKDSEGNMILKATNQY